MSLSNCEWELHTDYTYDENGRLLSAYGVTVQPLHLQQPSGHTANGQTTSYAYNTDGIRTQQGSPTQSTTYLIDQNRDYAQVLAEYDRAGLKKSYSYGDDLISQTQGTTTHYYHYDGLGSTRALSDTNGTLTDTYAYDAFGSLLSQTGVTENAYRFTGEQYDAGLDQYYLRARYYDQEVGRFTQQDSWMGKDSDPMTLHKYLYANGDPVGNIDPSGQMSLGGMMTGMNIQVSLSMTTTIVARSLFSRAFVGAALRYGLQAIKKEVKICLREALLGKGNRCKLDVPIVIAANDYPNQKQHIKDAQEGLGNNIGGVSLRAVLRYQKSDINRNTWPQKNINGSSTKSPNGLEGCTRADYERTKLKLGANLDCDEYPFSASMEGGYKNFIQGRVSGRFIPHYENYLFGFRVISFLGRLNQGDYYIVAPADYAYTSRVINKK